VGVKATGGHMFLRKKKQEKNVKKMKVTETSHYQFSIKIYSQMSKEMHRCGVRAP